MAKSFRDRFFLTRLTQDEHKIAIAFWIIVILFILLFAAMAYMYIALQREKTVIIHESSNPVPSSLTPVIPSIIPTRSVNAVEPLTQPTTAQQSSVKEYFIPFGAGSSTAGDWTDVPGLTVQIDFGSYPHIKEIHFEASVSIPTANESASVRLFNVTDKHPVWYSEITLENGQFVSSNPVIYDTGLKTYQVQMRTSLKYTANLIQSRLHIILQ